jgi:hypothetical protein
MRSLRETIVRILEKHKPQKISKDRIVSLTFLCDCWVFDEYRQLLTTAKYEKLENSIKSTIILNTLNELEEQPIKVEKSHSPNGEEIKQYYVNENPNKSHAMTARAIRCIDNIVEKFKKRDDDWLDSYILSLNVVSKHDVNEKICLDSHSRRLIPDFEPVGGTRS